MFTRQKPSSRLSTAVRLHKALCCPNVYTAVWRQKAWSCCLNIYAVVWRQKAWSCCLNVYAAVWRQKAWSCCSNVYTIVRRQKCPNFCAGVRRQKGWSCCPNVYTTVRYGRKSDLEQQTTTYRISVSWRLWIRSRTEIAHLGSDRTKSSRSFPYRQIDRP